MLEAYATRTSYPQGGTAQICLSTDAKGDVEIALFRLSSSSGSLSDPFVPVPGSWKAPAAYHELPFDAPERGCGWPVAASIALDPTLVSGIYRVRLSIGGHETFTEFVVRPWPALLPSSSTKRILCVWPFATKLAYNRWGATEGFTKTFRRNFTGDVYSAGETATLRSEGALWRRRRVSMLRPRDNLYGGRGLLTDLRHDYCENRIYRFVEKHYGAATYSCSNVDLHDAAFDLSGFNLLVFMGHDEYWSDGMRDRVQAFIGSGGNVLFLTGNTLWYRVDFTDDGTTMVCPKTALEDPKGRLGVFSDSPANDPENTLLGLSFRYGTMATQAPDLKEHAYQVQDHTDWVYDRTGLGTNELFGFGGTGYPDLTSHSVLYWETDSLETKLDDAGRRAPTGRDGTPLNFKILAHRELPSWQYWRGAATMGYYWRRTRVGDVMYCPVVFSAGTAGWGQRLLRTNPDANVERITLNLIDRLASRQVSPPPGATTEFALRSNTLPTKRWQEVPTGPTSITAAAGVIGSSPEGHLFVCAGGRLYRRAPVYALDEGAAVPKAEPWTDWGKLPPGTPLAAGPPYENGPFVAVVDDGTKTQVWTRWPDPDATWKAGGIAPRATKAFASGPMTDSSSYFLLADSPASIHEVRALYAFQGRGEPYVRVGDAEGLVAMTAWQDKLVALTTNNRLVCRDTNSCVDLRWIDFGAGLEGYPSANVRGLAAYYGRLFALTTDGKLHWRAIAGDDGPAEPGKLVFYRASTGELGVGAFWQNGEYHHQEDSNIGSGWTLLGCCAPGWEGVGRACLVAYNTKSGAYQTYRVERTGEIMTVGSGAMTKGFTHVVQAQRRVLLFYNQSHRSGAIYHVRDDGGLMLVQSWAANSFSHWTDIVSTDDVSLLFYNSGNGDTLTARYDGAISKFGGPFGPGTLPTGMRFLPVGQALLFGFEPATSRGRLYRLKFSRALTRLAVWDGFSSWDKIVGGSNGLLFFYREDGTGLTAGVAPRILAEDSRNAFVPLLDYGTLFSPGWDSIVAV